MKKAAGISALQPPGSSNWDGFEILLDPAAPVIPNLIRKALNVESRLPRADKELRDSCQIETRRSQYARSAISG
jgi:hypothetical protein